MNSRPSGIKGLEGRRPIGAALTIGRKKPQDPRSPRASFGYPEHRDRFYVVAGRADSNDIKPPHPMFEKFNSAPVKYRQYVTGSIVNATRDRCFSYNLRCQSPKSVNRALKPSGRKPFCTGNGEVAQRWAGSEYQSIVCPGDRCEYQQPEGPNGKFGKPCKPFATFVFELGIPSFQSGPPGPDGFPSITVKFSTASWNSTANILGLFDEFDEQVKNLGIAGASLFGFPFGLQLMEGADDKGHKFPVVGLTPLVSVPQFLYAQREQMVQIGARPRYALTDRSADDIDKDHEDYAPGARVVEN